MNGKIKAFAALTAAAVFALTAAACTNKPVEKPSGGQNTPPTVGSGIAELIDVAEYTAKADNAATDDAEDFVEDETWKNHVVIECGDEIKVTNGNPAEITVTTEDGNIAVSSLKKMTLTLRGRLDGSVSVDKPDGKLKLILDGVAINSPVCGAIKMITEKRVFVELGDGTENTLTDKSFAFSETPPLPDVIVPTATLFSKEQLTISGSGKLTVNGNAKHGIASRDYVRVRSGDVKINAASDGIHANDGVIIDGGSLGITSGSDGIECDSGYVAVNGGYVKLAAGGDGIATTYDGTDPLVNSEITIKNGIIEAAADGEGITGSSTVTVDGGFTAVRAKGDGLNAATGIAIGGGYLFAASETDDGIDSNGWVDVSGGTVVALGGAAPCEGIDCNGNTFAITGGTIVAAAGATALPTESECTQGAVIYGGIAANGLLRLTSGDTVLAFGFESSYATLLLSTRGIRSGVSCTLTAGGSVSGKSFYGLYLSPVCEGGAAVKTFTPTTTVTHLSGVVK